MKRLLYISSILLLIFAILFVNPDTALASEGDDEHQLEFEVNGYHVVLDSQNDWVKGENTIIVTLTDDMGMPLSNADVEILITPKSGGHVEAETDSHGAEQQNDPMAGMDMGNEPAQESSMPGMDMDVPETQVHEEENTAPVSMMESDEHGMYMVETHLESSGEHDVHVMFHVNGEMLQADFVVNVTGSSSKSVVLWGFATINVALIFTAGVMKKQKLSIVKGAQ